MFSAGDTIDGRYLVKGACSDAGGMGSLLFVTRVGYPAESDQVLKYCKLSDPEMRSRFKREVRLMKQFTGNRRVVQILHSNLDHDPPYFVMPHFEAGDLTKVAVHIKNDHAAQELVFNEIIDCVSELHAKNVFHRDIKPQNFLVDEDASIAVSDLGLSTEVDSSTGLTRSSKFWGTPGYLPPEFAMPGGFRDADASSDVFMLGKTFYFVLSGRDPTYLLPDGVPGPLFAFIERCCAIAKTGRYQSLASLRQSLTAVYDVLLGRAVGSALAVRTLRSISDRLKASSKFKPEEVVTFIEQLDMLEAQDKIQLCLELPDELFPVLAQKSVQGHLVQFLRAYREMAEEGTYAWSFAEDIADHMKILFEGDEVNSTNKAEALRIAIIAARRQNRFAAMDTCKAMITSPIDDELAQRIHDVILEFPDSFLTSIEESNCRASAIRSALAINRSKSED